MRLPPEPQSKLIHERSYTVRAYREGSDRLLLRGMVNDQKPSGIYFPDDPEPLDVHLMVVDLLLDYPSLEIVAADVVMEVTPHSTCTRIEVEYQKLVGLSIARGFSRKVKDLFGGPSGCTHIGALLQAMAPVAVQSMWSMRSLQASESGTSVTLDKNASAEARRAAMSFNLNTCHVWDEAGEFAQAALAGEFVEIPLWATARLKKLGRSASSWGDITGD